MKFMDFVESCESRGKEFKKNLDYSKAQVPAYDTTLVAAEGFLQDDLFINSA